MAGTLLLAACAPGLSTTGAGSPPDPTEARWIDGSTPDLRTLLLQPLWTASIATEEDGDLVEVRLGAFFTEWENEAGTTGNSGLLRSVPGGRQLSVVIPVSVEFLRQLAHARTVRGVFSDRAAFLLPEGSRRRFASLLRHLPTERLTRGAGPRLRISESTP